MKQAGQATPKISSHTASRWQTTAVFGLFALLALLMTWPVAARFGSEIAGGRDDLWIHQWTLWWLEQAISSGQNPFHTTMLYYPEGVALTSHNIAWLNFAAWWPLQQLFGPIIAYNLVTLTVFTLNGFGMFLLARSWFRQTMPAVLAGLTFGFWPYTLSHYDHTNMMVVFPVPLAMLFLTRTVRHGRWGDALGTAVFLALIGIARWQLLLMSSPLLAAYALFLLWQQRKHLSRSLSRLIPATLLALLLMLPLALPLIRDQLDQSGGSSAALAESPLVTITDGYAYFFPPWLYDRFFSDYATPLAAELLGLPAYSLIGAGSFYVPFLGFVALILALLGILSRKAAVFFWLIIALLYMAFALGNPLMLNGVSYEMIPMPYQLLEGSAIDAVLRRPHRLNIFLSLPIAMLVGHGVAWVLQKEHSKSSRYKAGIIIVLAGVMLLETRTAVGFAATPPNVPNWYGDVLAQEAGDFGLLNIPAHNRSFDKRAMYLQTIHGKPIGSGHVSRLPDSAVARLSATPLLTLLLNEKGTRLPNIELTAVSDHLHTLADDNIRYLIFDRTLLDDGFEAAWRDWLTIEPHYQDNDLLVYRTRPVAGEDFTLSQRLSPTVGLVRHTLSQQTAVSGGLIKLDARWGSAAAPQQNLQACLWLDGATKPDCSPIDSGQPTSSWGANAVVRAGLALPILPDVPTGQFPLLLQLQNERGEPQGETQLLGQIDLLPVPPLGDPLATWQNGLTLRGYTQSVDDTSISLTYFWSTSTQIANAYTLFVHLIDPESGEILSQSDKVPRDGQYPTVQWEMNELVHDTLTLTLPKRPFAIRLGWYDPLNNERLRLTDSSDDFFILPQTDATNE